ncbi:WASH complex subunit 1 isoform X1 [Diorhabda carinulata]|uniref:WASH complex subunit 1 isoform X1 n=1 Tax=Diorhabda carinulata TaxID=1163345 RepID=UPI0025A14349|nr:WASH complex subunit 1 isoform X1 [Diorhabda carinulata]
MKMDSKYSVPIIPQNSYQHETIIQIAEVLNHLTNVSEAIFGQISRRLETNKAKLSDISHRVDTVNKKINTLRGAKKATQVFSSSKYPASDINKPYVSAFHDAPQVFLEKQNVRLKNTSAAQGPLEKLLFYHVNIQQNTHTKLDGLGHTPQRIEFVNDLLLYNSGKNVYKDFVISGESNIPQYIKEDEERISEIGGAPQSISERSTLSKAQKQDYFYSPQIGEVPALDVPLDLPDLPGIANDLHYDSDLTSSIAPSADVAPSILELDFDTSNNLPNIPQENGECVEYNDIPDHKLPPVPQELPLKLLSPPKEVAKPELLEITKPSESMSSHVSSVTLPSVDDVRSSLMEAIRNAGGSGKAKLKSIQNKKEQEVATKVPQGNDFMADLHNTLFMRRKGISGAKQLHDTSIDADSTLSRISSMIPPPEPKPDPESTSNDEEEWD